MKWKLGLKTGAVAGAIYGLISGFIALAVAIINKDEILAAINAQFAQLDNVPVTAEQVYPITIAMSVPGAIFSGVIIGAVLGIVYTIFHEDLPTKKRKGFFFAILLLIGAGLAEMISAGHGLSWLMIQTQILWLTPFGIAAFLFFGFLLEKFYLRFRK